MKTLINCALLFLCLFGLSFTAKAERKYLDTIFYVSVQQSFFPIRNPNPQSIINQYLQYANQAFSNYGLDIRVRVAKIIDIEPSKDNTLNILADMLVSQNDWYFIDTDKK